MRDDGAASGPELSGARALREWITGERARYARVFLVEDGAAVDAVQDAAVEGDMILLPMESGPYRGSAEAVHYSGALRDVGDELFLGERGVELQDYVAAGFIQIVGPTAVCLFDGSSGQAFLDDADLARRTGVFPAALIDPRVLLADRGALARPDESATPSTIRVRADGRVSVGVHGDVIGSVDELPSLLAVARPRAAAVTVVMPGGELDAELRSREWIGRYLRATDLMKMLRLANGAARISGFGWTLVDDGLADAEPPAEDPLLIESEDGFILADTTTLRRQLLSPTTAQVVAITQTSSALVLAAERVARQLDLTSSEARILCLEAVAALGIHPGGRAESAIRTIGVDG